MSSGSPMGRVSVVITTRNEEAHIENCLRSVTAQTYSDVEVIVVDNASTDRTKLVARRYTDRVIDKGPERSAQRNHGMIHVATGEFVMFVDADMILAPCLIESCVGRMQGDACVALHVSEVVLRSGFWGRVRRFERGFYDGTVIDGARFFRREVFCAVGGFDEGVSGPEDWDLDKRIKGLGAIGLLDARPARQRDSCKDWSLAEVVRAHDVDPDVYGAVLFHDESGITLARYLRKKSRYAAEFRRYIDRWGRDDVDLRKQLGPLYRYVGVYFEDGKWRRLVAHPLLTVGMYGLRLLVGLAYLRSTFSVERSEG